MTENTPATLECGKTIEELSAYLAADRTPPDPDIEICPECLSALDGLDRVAQLSRDLIARDMGRLPAPTESWITSIVTNIAQEVRAGRSLPLHHDNSQVTLSITEGAVRALVRSVGDDIDGVVIGRCRIDGDAETLDAPVEVTITASILWGRSVQELSHALRQRVREALWQHTDLRVTAVNIIIDDLHGFIPDREAPQ
ncbi:Asp23/Gls24 family envelope stress response protein [Cryobacterium psychrophilum]|uniref:Asp23/Gls24 family envelope stress response protein n=1 Tax=Cryobacterium psychrophilum TaxID=41988 RepID=UPI001F542225|nr:Asp23/Gls24 family envelope stress response protein [Cryobacterium psychrophilum]